MLHQSAQQSARAWQHAVASAAPCITAQPTGKVSLSWSIEPQALSSQRDLLQLWQAMQKCAAWQAVCCLYRGPSLAPAVQYYRDGEGHRYRSRTDVLKALGLAESKAAVSKAQAAASAQIAAGDVLRATPLPLANGVLVERCGQLPAAVRWCAACFRLHPAMTLSYTPVLQRAVNRAQGPRLLYVLGFDEPCPSPCMYSLWLKLVLRPGRLGSIDPRPAFSTRINLWPVGYKATWQEDNVGSFQSEVMPGDEEGPLFRVTINPAGKGKIARVSSLQITSCTVAGCSPDMSSGNSA